MPSVSQSDRPLLIFESEVDLIVREVSHWPHLETGGDLFGYWTQSGAAVVCLAIGPGAGARHHATSFYQDARYLEREGLRLNDRFGLQHVGEWHSHHTLDLPHPSGGDARTVRDALARYRFERFALVICTLSLSRQAAVEEVSLQGYLFEAQRRDSYLTSPWVVLPERSPMRDRPTAAAGSRPLPRVRFGTGRCTMNDLRGGPPERRALETLGERWFTTPAGQRRLGDELAAFERAGLTAKALVSPSGDLHVAVLDDRAAARYLLPTDYPTTAPTVRWAGAEEGAVLTRTIAELGVSWDRDTLLCELHASLVDRNATEARVEGSDPAVSDRGADDRPSRQDGVEVEGHS
ncbi:MAG: hypothetical protein Q8S73_20335 [Deltaproteobacteria bacterium]|nr:hypothetical protein [Myxococcales bacterium]MDP3216468.1 hypothetical protein [Deltaproteobacteria bacterium]